MYSANINALDITYVPESERGCFNIKVTTNGKHVKLCEIGLDDDDRFKKEEKISSKGSLK